MEIKKNVFQWYVIFCLTAGVGIGLYLSEGLSKHFSITFVGGIISFICIVAIMYMQFKYKLHKKLQ